MHQRRVCKERLRFETLLSDLSARFMAIPFDQVDSEIDNALRQIMEFFQVDRCALLEVLEDKAFVRVSHVEYGEGVEQVSGEINLAELFPWSYEKLMQGKHLNISRVEDFPEEALRDRQSFAAMGIKSTLTIPLSSGGRIARIIVINTHAGIRPGRKSISPGCACWARSLSMPWSAGRTG